MNKQLILFLAITILAVNSYGKKSMESIKGAVTVDVAKVSQLMQEYTVKNGNKVRKVLFIDTRKMKDLKNGGTIPGAVHLNIKKKDRFNLENILNHPRFSGDVLVFCNGHSCHRAQNSALLLAGWKKDGIDGGRLGTIYYFRDGFPAYRDYVYKDGSKNPVIMPY